MGTSHTYHGWTVEQMLFGYCGSHPDFDADPCSKDDRIVFGNTVDEVHDEILRMLAEQPSRCTVPLTIGKVFGAIADAFRTPEALSQRQNP